MNSITNKNFLWFDDRFYVIPSEEIINAKKMGAKVSKDILDKISSGQKEIWLPSSTTILGASPKPWLAGWRGSLGNVEADRVINEALNKGSNVHNAINIWHNNGIIIYRNPRNPAYTQAEIEELTMGKPFIVLKEQQEHLEAYRLVKWMEEVKPKIVASEFTVASLEHGYAGTGDLLIEIEDGTYNINGSKPLKLSAGIYVVDYKTGNTFDKPNYTRQIASYTNALTESNDYKIEGGLIIHTNDNKVKGGIEGLKTYHLNKDDLTNGFDEFIKIKAVYEIDLNYQPKVIELPIILMKGEKDDSTKTKD